MGGREPVSEGLRKRRTEVVELDALDLDVERAAEQIEAACRRLALKGAEVAHGG